LTIGRVFLGFAGLVLSVVPSVAGSDQSAADSAFDKGDYEVALVLYNEILAEDPENQHALVRSGMLLSWSERYVEAIARYDRALALDPSQPKAMLERAKVLSWSKRYDEAIEGFQAILSVGTHDREARLGLARVLSWSGRQSAARLEYERLLETDPEDPEALLGVAQTHAWSGDDGRARPAYERALEADPDSKGARLGLAYVDFRQNDLAAVERRLESLHADYPGDDEVSDLARLLSRARAPWMRFGWDRLDDTDENTLTTWMLEGGLGLVHAMDLRLGVARYDMTTLGADGAIDSMWAVVGWVPVRRHRLEARVGADVQRPSSGGDDTVAIGGVRYRFPLRERWTGHVSWDRDSFRYSVPILDNGIVMDAFAARAEGSFGDSWRAEAGVGAWSLSDGNDRKSLEGSVLHAWKIGEHTLEAGYAFRWFDWREDPGNGYFSPSDFTAHLALGRARGPVGKKGYYDVAAEAGVQSFTQGTREVSADPAVSLYAVAGRPLGAGFDLEGFGAWSTSAPQGGENYRARRLGVRLRYTFGEDR
jgi:tetratricopeptide (TPR) repeat protein